MIPRIAILDGRIEMPSTRPAVIERAQLRDGALKVLIMLDERVFSERDKYISRTGNPLTPVPITLVGVQSLFLDESLIAIEAIAVVSE